MGVTALLGLVAAGLAVALVVTAVAMMGQRRRADSARSRLDDLSRRLAPLAGGEPLAGDAGPERLVEAVAASVAGWRAATRQMRQALDAIPQGVVIVDASGAVVHRNRVAAGFESARHSDALVGSALDDLVSAAANGVQGSRTLDLFGPPRRTVVVSATPLLAGDDLVGALAVIDDVSEVRRLDAVRRDFVANISHELKTPVGAISLLAETIAAEDEPEVSARLAARMVDEATRVSHTIDDLLVLSRIETEEAEVRERVSLDLVVAEAVERITRAAEQAGITITVEHLDGSFVVMGDRRQLVSAVYNLLDNAVKYSDPGSPVEVSGRRAAADADDGERADGSVTRARAGVPGDDSVVASTDVVELSVRDRGIGIPARDMERVFERFYRVDQARSRRTGGTGLGLAIVRHVANNHQGEVRVESRLGEGSTFILRFPAAPPTGTEVAADGSEPEEWSLSDGGDRTPHPATPPGRDAATPTAEPLRSASAP